MLDFSTPFHHRFAATHATRISELGQASMAGGTPRPGERSVQATFSEEWNSLQEDELTFTYTDDDLKQLHREVFLKWGESPPPGIGPILNVGCGFGKEAEVLQAISGGAEVYAIDLNFSLLNSGPRLKERRGLHVVMASAYAVPFAPGTFGLVYSQGVIHHSYNTERAFRHIAQLVRPAGTCFLWVYALEDHLVKHGAAGVLARLRWWSELVLRPIVSRLPVPLRGAAISVLGVIFHGYFKRIERHGARWKWKNTIHRLYDDYAPRYAHRHSFNEVIEWFEQEGFGVTVHSPKRYRELFGLALWGVGVLGQRVRAAD
jgi:SAM-dependent methyltransferase